MAPFVSILLPSKNPGRFLKERLDSIFAQSIEDWELIIVDSDSTDGSREIFQDLVKRDRRVVLYERPAGLYPAWNFAIKKAQGKYVYIATADDTMAPDALKKMSDALEAHPECDLCDTRLQLIDAEGNGISEFSENALAIHWHFAFPRDVMHIRRKPADFFAHLGGKTIYTSITQLLIRRSLFEKTGLFPENYGSRADYMWGMRAALVADVVYLPEKLASWRIHASQATFAAAAEKGNQNFFLMAQMAQEVLRDAPPAIAAAGRKVGRLALFKGILLPAKRYKNSLGEKFVLMCRALVRTPLFTLEFLLTMPFYLRKIPRRFLFLYTYDQMILRHTRRYYRGKIQNL